MDKIKQIGQLKEETALACKASREECARLEEKMSRVLEQLRRGGAVLVADDEARENETDLVAAAEVITYETLNTMAADGRGLICVPLAEERARQLKLPPQTAPGTATDPLGTAFTVSVDAAQQVTTGISIADRLTTIRRLADSQSRPEDLRRPGHIFPLVGKPGGVFERPGHTEASLELSRLAGFPGSAVICEVLGADGAAAGEEELCALGKRLNLPRITIGEILRYLPLSNGFVQSEAETFLPTEYGEFQIKGYRSRRDGKEHLALIRGNPGGRGKAPLVRLHSECLTGDLLGSLRCDCGAQLQKAMEEINHEGEGVIIYLRQEGRGIGLFNKLKAYQLQDQGLDTVDANLHLGFAPDLRDYAEGAAILRDLGISAVRLMSNNPQKASGLASWGIKVDELVAHQVIYASHSRRYMETKRLRMGHLLKVPAGI